MKSQEMKKSFFNRGMSSLLIFSLVTTSTFIPLNLAIATEDTTYETNGNEASMDPNRTVKKRKREWAMTLTQASIQTTNAVLCVVACNVAGTPAGAVMVPICQTAGIVSLAYTTASSVATTVMESQDASQIAQALAPQALGTMMQVQSLTSSGLGAGTSGSKSEQQEKAGCPMSYIMPAMMAGFSWWNARTYGKQYRQAKKDKAEILARADNLTTADKVLNASDTSVSNNGPTTNGSGDTRMPSSTGGSTDLDDGDTPTPTELAATAQEFAPAIGTLLNDYQKNTGKNPMDIFNAASKGINPLTVAADHAGTNGGAGLAEIAANSDKIAEYMIAKGKSHPANIGTQSQFGGSRVAAKQTGSSGPDFNALLKGLMPQDQKEKGPNGATAMGLGIGQAADKEGFHPASQSIFDVVDHRYQQVSSKFLAGDALVRTPAAEGMAPRNLYLSH